MLKTLRSKSLWGARLKALLAAILLAGSGAAMAANVTVNLCATTGSVALPGAPSPVNVYGYAVGDCSTVGTVTVPGGPVIDVNVGDVVTVNLVNKLPAASGLLFQGQTMIPDTTGAAALTGSKSYTFTAGSPGTYLYEAAPLPGAEYQVAMGLYGALIVRPTIAGQAYDAAVTAFDTEATLVLSEIDPALGGTTASPGNPAGFDMRKFAPKYFLINGKPYPNTDPIASTAGNKVLLRYVNAGAKHHSMGVLGLRQVFVAKDASTLPTLNHNVAAETLAPGQTGDAIVTVPAATTTASRFAVFDASLSLHNSNATGFGGMLTFIAAGSTAAPGPTVTALAVDPGWANLTATIAAGSGRTVVASEYWIDSGAHTPIAVTTPAGTVTVTAAISLAAGTSHTVYVRGQDDLLTWGQVRPLALVAPVTDTQGPTSTGLVLTPNPSNGTVAVALTATGDDRASGNSNIAAAEYAIDGGTAVPMTPNTTSAPVASLSASIAAATVNALSAGPHNVTVRSQDALGNWGPWSAPPAVLQVAKAGPTTTFPATGAILPDDGAIPGYANNGARPLSATQAVVRVTAVVTATAGSGVSGAEGFIDTNPATTVRGFPFAPSDGAWSGLNETVYADIPLSTVNALAAGNHTIYVRGKDLAGNWGDSAPVVLLIDRTAPTFTGTSLSWSVLTGTITLNVLGAADPMVAGLASGVAGGEYWIDTAAPAAGAGTPFTGSVATIPVGTLSTGNHTIGTRIRDAAGNWSTTTASASVSVVADAIFANGFEGGTTFNSWGWSSDTTNNTTRLNATTGAAYEGVRKLQAQGNNTNYVQQNFGSNAQPATATYDARFYFNPNGNTGTNQDIFVARTTGGTTVFRVRYRWNGGAPQVQIQVGTGTGNAAWTSISNAAFNRIELVWQAGGTLQLFVGTNVGTADQSLAATANLVGQVRLGSVISGGSSTLEYFDAFASKRSVTTLFGP